MEAPWRHPPVTDPPAPPDSYARAQGYVAYLLTQSVSYSVCLRINYLAASFKHKVLGPTPRGSDSAHLRWGLRIFVPNTFPGKADAAGPGPTARELPPAVAVHRPCFSRQAECTHCLSRWAYLGSAAP